MREVLVSVTFREFDGSTNAQIQQRFLEGLQKQSYKNFRLIATNYRERYVRQALDKTGLPYEFHQSEKDCMCSWTEVIRNSFQYLRKGQSVILWTNADNVFEPNLFSEIIDSFDGGSGGTSYPHIPYAGLEDFERGHPTDTWKLKPLRSSYQLDPNYWVPDTIYIDGDLMLDPANQRLFLEHEFGERWPGQAQTLVLAFFADKLKNLFFRSKIAMISNVRTETQTVEDLVGTREIEEAEAKRIWGDHFQAEENRSLETLIRFCKAKGVARKFIPGQHPLKKLNQHSEYKIVGRVDQKLLYAAYMRYWMIRHLLRFATHKVFRR